MGTGRPKRRDMQILAGVAAALVLLLIMRAIIRRGESPFAAGAAAVPPSESSIREFLLRGQKIEAIKAYRALHRVDLKAAKEAVEQIAEEMPRG